MSSIGIVRFGSLAAASLLVAPSGWMPAAPSLRQVATLRTPSAVHTATTLATGRVLIVGGMADGGSNLASVELFDPARNALEQLRPLAEARSGHSATLLRDGRVLVAGGYNGNYLSSVEIFEPSTGRFRPVGSLTEGRRGAVASATCSAAGGSRVKGLGSRVECDIASAEGAKQSGRLDRDVSYPIASSGPLDPPRNDASTVNSGLDPRLSTLDPRPSATIHPIPRNPHNVPQHPSPVQFRARRDAGRGTRRSAPVRAESVGFFRPSQANAPAFDRAVDEVSEAVTRLLESLQTSAPPKDREAEARKRAARRLGDSAA